MAEEQDPNSTKETSTVPENTPTEMAGELDPKTGKKSRPMALGKQKGVVIASNADISLHIIEVNAPGKAEHGSLIRCYESVAADLKIGPNGTPLTFTVGTLTLGNGSEIEVAQQVSVKA
jgi:hypothetical protein